MIFGAYVIVYSKDGHIGAFGQALHGAREDFRGRVPSSVGSTPRYIVPSSFRVLSIISGCRAKYSFTAIGLSGLSVTGILKWPWRPSYGSSRVDLGRRHFRSLTDQSVGRLPSVGEFWVEYLLSHAERIVKPHPIAARDAGHANLAHVAL
jgi:hypothetical protein